MIEIYPLAVISETFRVVFVHGHVIFGGYEEFHEVVFDMILIIAQMQNILNLDFKCPCAKRFDLVSAR